MAIHQTQQGRYVYLSHPDKKRQRENRKKKIIWEATTIDEMVDREFKMQKKRDAEYGWQFVYGNHKIYDETPVKAACNNGQ